MQRFILVGFLLILSLFSDELFVRGVGGSSSSTKQAKTLGKLLADERDKVAKSPPSVAVGRNKTARSPSSPTVGQQTGKQLGKLSADEWNKAARSSSSSFAVGRVKAKLSSSAVGQQMGKELGKCDKATPSSSSTAAEKQRSTLADLLALAQEEEKRKSSEQPKTKGKLAELFELERIAEDDFNKFVAQLREEEQIIEEVFKPKSAGHIQAMKGKLVRAFSKRKEKEKTGNGLGKEKVKVAVDNRRNEFEKTLIGIKRNDPALSQVIVKLHAYGKKAVSGKLLEEPLKNYVKFAIKFLAKRQKIAEHKLVPVHGMGGKMRTVAALLKLCIDEKHENVNKQQQKKAQQKSSADGESNSSWEERFLRLLLTIVDDEDGTANLALEFDFKKQRKRRSKRVDPFFCLLLLLLALAAVSAMAHRIGKKIANKCIQRRSSWSDEEYDENNIGQLWEWEYEAKVDYAELVASFNALGRQSVPLTTQNVPSVEDDDGTQCSVCLVGFQPNELVRPLPCDGKHFFHDACIIDWFKQHNTCPICRTEFTTKNGKFVRYVGDESASGSDGNGQLVVD